MRVAAVLSLLLTVVCTCVGDDAGETIYSIISSMESLSTLKAAIDAAGLVDALNEVSRDSVTLFAPSNDAFEAAGVSPETFPDAETLSNILLYHVLVRALTARNLQDLDGPVMTLQGSYLGVDFKRGTELLFIGGGATKGKITGDTVLASNGVLLPVDTVLLPTDGLSCTEVVLQYPALSSLAAAIDAFQVGDIIAGISNITFLAPNNRALERFGQPLTPPLLLGVVLNGKFLQGDFVTGNVTTAGMTTVDVVRRRSGRVFFNGVKVRTANIQCDGSVVHIVKGVVSAP